MRSAALPAILPGADALHATLDFGGRRAAVSLDGAGHWVHADTWSVYADDGALLWAPEADDDEPSGRPTVPVGIRERYTGGPLRPLPYAGRLRKLHRERDPEAVAEGRLLVLAGSGAWGQARRILAAINPRSRARPFVVLPPGEDPRGFDWGPLGVWRAGREVPRLRRDLGMVEHGAGWPVLICDFLDGAPVDQETRELVAVEALLAGCAAVEALVGRQVIEYLPRRVGGDDGR